MKKFLIAFTIATAIIPAHAGLMSHGIAYGVGHAGKGALKQRVAELEQENARLRAKIQDLQNNCGRATQPDSKINLHSQIYTV